MLAGMPLGRSGNSRGPSSLPTVIRDVRFFHDELPEKLSENYPDRISHRHVLPCDERLVVACGTDMVSADG